jgi:hypothetical protein
MRRGQQQQQQEGQPTFSPEDFTPMVALNIHGVQCLCVGWGGVGVCNNKIVRTGQRSVL